jgi:hypothetical protein
MDPQQRASPENEGEETEVLLTQERYEELIEAERQIAYVRASDDHEAAVVVMKITNSRPKKADLEDVERKLSEMILLNSDAEMKVQEWKQLRVDNLEAGKGNWPTKECIERIESVISSYNSTISVVTQTLHGAKQVRIENLEADIEALAEKLAELEKAQATSSIAESDKSREGISAEAE